MPDQNNQYVFCADYSSMASCLAAIYADKTAGLYQADQALLDKLNTFENDLLKKLYQRVITVLGVIEGAADPDILQSGDFYAGDFYSLDFLTGYQETGSGFSSQFQTVLNIFALLCSREDELSQDIIDSIATVFIPVLEAFGELEEALAAAGFEPCRDTPVAYFNNAPEIRLQAAGSDGSTGIAEGILLRWLLNGQLGDRHLPQGDYASSQGSGFNLPDDYVRISRTPYTAPVVFNLDFSALRPAISASEPRWTYILNLTRDGRKYSNTVILEFRDAAAYRAQHLQVNPLQDPAGFLKGYAGQLDIRFRDKTAFRFGLTLRKSGQSAAILKLAALARPDAGITGDVTVLRDRLEIQETETVKNYTVENIRIIRLQTDGNAYPAVLSFETYDDFLKSRAANAWTTVGSGFGLSLDDATVFSRLEEHGRVEIDQSWPQYRDGTTLRVTNYQDKWSRSTGEEPSVKTVLSSYLSQSQSGIDPVLNVNPFGGDGFSLRYIDLLNLQAADYHFARMLGLGHIDTPEAALNDRFVYRMTYRNRTSLSAEIKDLVYLSLPVAKNDLRLPAKPLMRPVNYHLSVEGRPDAGQFDAQGYNVRNRVRLVNIGRAAMESEIPDEDFFSSDVPNALFDHGANTSAVWFGLEYRTAGDTAYVLPYITDDQAGEGRVYTAYNSAYHAAHGTDAPETVLLQDNEDSLFLHLEKNAGIHEYAIYGVDLFSRASELSEAVQTDETVFPPDNQLRPPTELTVQYIQKENTPVFTAEREQTWLAARDAAFPGQDTAFTRLTFNWVDIKDVSGLDPAVPDYLSEVIKGNRAGILYRPTAPLQLSGLVRNVTELTETSVQVTTAAYTLLDGSTQQPAIGDTDFGRFTGSLLLTDKGPYEVLSVTRQPGGTGSSAGLVLTLAKNKVTEMADEDPENPGSTATRYYYVAPSAGGRFTLMENLSEATNWQQVRAEIPLIDHSDPAAPVIDTIYDEQGKASRFWIGGIHAQATVSLARDNDDQVLPGYYLITCAQGTVLPPHPQGTSFDPAALSPQEPHTPYVEWYNGRIFLPLPGNSGEKKAVDVVGIKNIAPLTLYAYDPGFQTGDRPVLTENDPQRSMTVNYHPGYRAYLMTEPAPDQLNAGNLLPAPGANDKKSMLAVQTLRRETGQPTYSSSVSLPAVLLALRIQVPLPPERPQAATLKVRPDATGRAAFTFDLPVLPENGEQKHEPFGWTFYRTHHELVLRSLYQPGTVNDILSALGSFTSDPFFADRYISLLEQQFDPSASGVFKQYPVTAADGSEAVYGFPVPDLPELQLDGNGNVLSPDSAERIARYERAIHKTLMPLTEQTPILAYIKTGKQTENHPPAIRTADNKLMNFGDPGFDAFPMIRQYQGASGSYFIRFTDYTLRGSARFLYFYVAAEVTNRLEIGPLGGFTGPVTVLNTIPGEAPVVRSYSTGLNDGEGDSPVKVTFRLSPHPAYDTVTGVRLFRTTDPSKTWTLAAMGSALDATLIRDPQTGGLTVTDNFAGLSPLPLGETIYYRLAFIRQIINEANQAEEILSLGSEVQEIRLIDSFNPETPELSYDESDGSLHWQPTANKGTYYLYQQNSRGNWQVISRIDNADNGDMSFPVILPGPDAEGNPVYSRFKVKAQNASGLFSLTDKELTV
ncbi:hypothetical protein LX99_04248 [Mucilaginibacter oryzae]|uniref:Uncharacterized protein n=1 Tax=Mucilaginibacter oryzae TaxID=468058 RepID=A0A316H864_9SPHI|nr:hypothetical protein [Mucilaginibacter oryzae]PWK72918.1 hypothetical protein LX99_04248 [Mucilaginibacter oryzae]